MARQPPLTGAVHFETRRTFPIALALALAAVVSFAAFVVSGAVPKSAIRGFVVATAIFMTLASGLLCVWRRSVRNVARDRQAVLNALAAAPHSPIWTAMLALWLSSARPPDTPAMARALAEASVTEGRALLALSTLARPHPAGDYRFEPHIVSPAIAYRVLPRLLVIACVAVGLLLLVSPRWGVLRAPAMLLGTSGLCCSLPSLLVLGSAWIVSVWLAPAYVRIAPGMIEILRYGPFSSRPRITSFPIAAGTGIVVTGWERYVATVYLHRNGQSAKVHRTMVRTEGDANEVIWSCLMTTAESPPLADDALIG